jgi:hypothetical protein
MRASVPDPRAHLDYRFVWCELARHAVDKSVCGTTIAKRRATACARRSFSASTPPDFAKTPGHARLSGDVMKVKAGIRQSVLSLIVFVIVLAGLVSVDARVRDRFSDLMAGDAHLSPWSDRVGDLGSALASAIRHQSVENAPVLVFTTVGIVLFLFMVRS